MKLKKLEKKRNAYFIYTAIVCFLMVALCLVFVLYLGRKTVSVVSRSSDVDLSMVVPETDNVDYFRLRDDSISTDRGVFQVIREGDNDYISFRSNEGEEIKLLKGAKKCRFVNLQLVQPYLYFVEVVAGTKIGSKSLSETYSVLYRLNLSDYSLSHYPLYTSAYFALSNGDIIRDTRVSYYFSTTSVQKIGDRLLLSHRVDPVNDVVGLSLFNNGYIAWSDWENKNQKKISVDQINEIAGILESQDQQATSFINEFLGISDPQTTDDAEP